MRTVVFAGTTEGRELSEALAKAGAQVTVSVASEYGAEEQGQCSGITVEEGLKDEEEMRQMIREADLVVDATHPYAVLATENIRHAAEKEGRELLRLIRDQSGEELTGEGDIRSAADAAEAAEIALRAAGPEGRIMLTTGAKDLPVYAEHMDPEHLFPRVLPLVGSIEVCQDCGIPRRNILAIQGPFSQALNEALIRDFAIDAMITKESGAAGGFREKILACRQCGIPAIVIARPQEQGLAYGEVLEICLKRLAGEA